MAWARRLPNRRGYLAEWRDATGKRCRVKGAFAVKEHALKRAREEEQRARHGWGDSGAERTPFGAYALGWADTKGNVRPRTRINVEGRLRNHILPAFGDSPIGAIRPRDVRE